MAPGPRVEAVYDLTHVSARVALVVKDPPAINFVIYQLYDQDFP